MKSFGLKDTIAPTLSLFASMSTLLCCALPALLVTLGMGAALAGFISEVPQITWVSENKIYVFAFAAFMLTVAGITQWRARYLPCPADPAQAKACMRLRKISLGIYLFSLLMFLTGAFFAFVAPYVLI